MSACPTIIYAEGTTRGGLQLETKDVSFIVAATALLASLVIGWTSSAHAQERASDFPSKPVTMVIATAPGGPTDTEVRLYAQKMTDALGKPFVLDFKAGAGSAIGISYVAKSAPDGYTLLTVTEGFPIPLRDAAFDPIKDFTGVSLMTRRPTVLYVNPELPVTNLKEYIAYARANPGKINFGTNGPGASIHLAGLWLHSATKTEVTFIHYKGGSQAVPDLMSGRIQAYRRSLSGMMPLITAGKLRAIAVASLERTPLLPGVRTIAEDVEGYDGSSWLGFVAPAATPATAISRLNSELVRIAKAPDVVKVMEAQGATTVGSSAEALTRHIQAEALRYRALIRDYNIKLEE